MAVKITQKDFICRAVSVHGDLYDYSKSVYKNYRTKVCIQCKVHGEFYQTPHDHISGKYGCRFCGKESASSKRMKSKEEFKKEIENLYPGIFNIDSLVYSGMNSPVRITHINFGEFEICPKKLLYQNPKRGDMFHTVDFLKKEKQVKIENFLKRAEEVHGDKFTYDMVNYNGHESSISIYCKEHKKHFTQKTKHHLKSNGGCPDCKSDSISRAASQDLPSFIKKAVEIWGDSLDFSKTVYKNNKTKSVFVCRKHGEFTKTPNDIIGGHGCKLCGTSKLGKYNVKNSKNRESLYKEQTAILYLMKIHNSEETFYKVGISISLFDRISNIKSLSKCEVEVIHSVNMTLFEAVNREHTILDQLSKYSYLPKKRFSGYRECLSVDCLEEVNKAFTQIYDNYKD